MAEKLLPCPFCGGVCDEPQNYGDSRDGLHRFVACRKCGASLYRFKPEPGEADAALIEAWNTRSAPERRDVLAIARNDDNDL